MIDNLTDDRFGCFIDNFYEAGLRKIFSEISISEVYVSINLSLKNKLID